MAYLIRSEIAKSIDSFTAKFQKWPVLCISSRLLLKLLLLIPYLGMLVAPTLICSLPFQFLAWLQIKPPSFAYWILATQISLLEILIFLIGVRNVVLNLRRRRQIDIESLIGLMGFALSLAFIIYILPTGWFED